MASLPILTDYYRVTIDAVDPGGGHFPVQFAIRRMDTFAGDGTEMGGGAVNGNRQLRRVLDKFCDGLNRTGWANCTVVSVESNATSVLSLNLPAPD